MVWEFKRQRHAWLYRWDTSTSSLVTLPSRSRKWQGRIRWTTESELNNAGFNILRSDTPNGTFKQVNAKLIQGQGNTGERHSYKWIDTSAKHGVSYYYQIEDVSFAVERNLLATNKVKV